MAEFESNYFWNKPISGFKMDPSADISKKPELEGGRRFDLSDYFLYSAQEQKTNPETGKN